MTTSSLNLHVGVCATACTRRLSWQCTHMATTEPTNNKQRNKRSGSADDIKRAETFRMNHQQQPQHCDSEHCGQPNQPTSSSLMTFQSGISPAKRFTAVSHHRPPPPADITTSDRCTAMNSCAVCVDVRREVAGGATNQQTLLRAVDVRRVHRHRVVPQPDRHVSVWRPSTCCTASKIQANGGGSSESTPARQKPNDNVHNG